MKRILISLSILMLGTQACNLAALPLSPEKSAAATTAARTLEALIPETTPTELILATATVAVSQPTTIPPTAAPTGVSLAIPNGVAASAASETLPEANGPDLPVWEIHPAHTHITLAGYPLQDTLLKPEIFIYPADAFASMSPGAAQAVAELRSLLAQQGTQSGGMPFLPLINAQQVFYSNASRISFQNGAGYRYITQFDQAPLPINNHELIYTFQGMTTDGRWYVAAILPIHAPFLSADSLQGSPLPAGGVPFDWNNMGSMPVYLQAVQQRLESLDPNAFTPSLPALDSLIQSLNVMLP